MLPLRNVRQSDAVKAFCRLGGKERDCGKGSHRVAVMPSGRILSIPKGVIRIGLLHSLLKEASVTPEEFQREL